MKTLVVTGAAGGIGKQTLIALSDDLTHLICIDNNESRLTSVVEQLRTLPGKRTAVVSELNNQQNCESVLNAIDGPLHGFIHLAGIFENDDGFNAENYDKTIQHNLTNGYIMAGLIARRFDQETVSSMVFIASLAFNRGSPDYVAYSAAKGGLIGMTRALSRKLAPYTRVNAITPGIIDTPMPARIIEQRGDNLIKEIPLGRIGQPFEVAAVIRFLMSADASYITGQIINVDGGVVNL